MSLNPADVSKYTLVSSGNKRPQSLVGRADQATNIVEIYNEMGGTAPGGSYRSYKVHCPFNYEHGDGGLDKNCRIYPPTHIYCFASHGSMKPTFLYSKWKGIRLNQAATELLERKGLLKPKYYAERWKEIQNEVHEQKVNLGSKTDAIAVLQEAISANEEYQVVEFSKPIRDAWSIILIALDVLWERPNTDLNDLNKWYSNSLKKLNSVIASTIKDSSGKN